MLGTLPKVSMLKDWNVYLILCLNEKKKKSNKEERSKQEIGGTE